MSLINTGKSNYLRPASATGYTTFGKVALSDACHDPKNSQPFALPALGKRKNINYTYYAEANTKADAAAVVLCGGVSNLLTRPSDGKATMVGIQMHDGIPGQVVDHSIGGEFLLPIIYETTDDNAEWAKVRVSNLTDLNNEPAYFCADAGKYTNVLPELTEEFTATGSQTAFDLTGFTISTSTGVVKVSINGGAFVTTGFTRTDTDTITLDSGATAGDLVVIKYLPAGEYLRCGWFGNIVQIKPEYPISGIWFASINLDPAIMSQNEAISLPADNSSNAFSQEVYAAASITSYTGLSQYIDLVAANADPNDPLSKNLIEWTMEGQTAKKYGLRVAHKFTAGAGRTIGLKLNPRNTAQVAKNYTVTIASDSAPASFVEV